MFGASLVHVGRIKCSIVKTFVVAHEVKYDPSNNVLCLIAENHVKRGANTKAAACFTLQPALWTLGYFIFGSELPVS